MAALERTPVAPRRRWPRRLVIFFVVAGLLALTYHLALPHVIEFYVRGKLDDVAERSGREIRFSELELIKLHRYRFHDLWVSDPDSHSDRPFITADELTVNLDRARLFTGRLTIRDVEIVNPVIYLRDYSDGVSNYQDIFHQLQVQLGVAEPDEVPEGTGEAPPTSDRPDRRAMLDDLVGGAVPNIVIRGGRLDVSEARPGGPRAVDRVLVNVESAGEGLACDFAIEGDIDDIRDELLSQPVNHFEISGSVNVGDELGSVTIGMGRPIELAALPGLPDVGIRVGSVGFEYPYSFHVTELAVLDRQTDSAVLEMPRLTVALRELTTDPEQFYISLVEADDVRLNLRVNTEGQANLERMLNLPAGYLTGLSVTEPEPDEDDPTANGDEPSAEPDDGGLRADIRAELDRRKWWEIAPQTTVLQNLQVTLTVEGEDGERSLRATLPSLRAAKRLLNFQMDVTTRIELSEPGHGELGAVEAEFVYFYMSDHWGLDASVDGLDIGQLFSLLPYENPLELADARLDGTLTMNERRPDAELLLAGRIALGDLALSAPSVDQATVEDVNLQYEFAASVDDEANLSLSRGDLAFNGVNAELLLDVGAIDPEAVVEYLLDFRDETQRHRPDDELDPLPWSSVRLRIDMPRQPVMDVFEAVPAALRSYLEGTEMTGEVGWQLDALAVYSLDDRGRLRVAIERPAVADVLDEGIELVNLPEPVDVRRLLTEFTFTFSDGIGEMRELTVGPMPAVGEEVPPWAPPAEGDGNPRWVPLSAISPAMVTSILNTEDQGFFENHGFNWYQFRVVLADLLAEREFGRGASTIAMQLVKNVFLSRERLLSRKLAEMFLTYWMDRLVPKERILELYLNVIEFGPGINGISEAAEHYFGKLASDLTLSEATFLVSIVPNPREYHFYYEQGGITDRWWAHMQRYIERLFDREAITEDEYMAALDDRPEFYFPGDGDPPLRPAEPEEPALPPDIILPFLLDGDHAMHQETNDGVGFETPGQDF